MVSLVPHFNRALARKLRQGVSGPAVCHGADGPGGLSRSISGSRASRNIWFAAPSTPSSRPASSGHLDGTVFQTSGMILHPRFYEPAPADRIAERKKLGLDPDLPTGIVLFGGYGTSKMLHILRQINRSSLQVQLILICGRNEKLAQALRREPSRIPHPRGRIHDANSVLHGALGFFHRQAGAGQHQRGALQALARDHRLQRVDAAAGTLQRAVGSREGSWHRGAATTARLRALSELLTTRRTGPISRARRRLCTIRQSLKFLKFLNGS